MAVQTRIQFRRDTYANWNSANPTLLAGEIGYITSGTNAGSFKIGDGSTAWNSLSLQGNVAVTSPATNSGTATAPNISVQDGTTSQKGAVQLLDSTSSTSTTLAAVPNSVKTAYDLANGALPKTGGTMTGKIVGNNITGTGIAASLNLSGVADPASLVSGDLWVNSGGIKYYNGSATRFLAFTDSAMTGTVNGVTFTGTSGKTLTVSNSLTLAGTDATTMTFPSTSGTVVTLAGGTFTGKIIGVTTTTSVAPLNLTGTTVDPSAPTSGDLWVNTGALKYYTSSTTKTIAFTDSTMTGSLTGSATLTGTLTLRAGTATAGTAPLYMAAGTNLTVPVYGAVEAATDALYATNNPGSTSTGAGRGLIPATHFVFAGISSASSTSSTTTSVFDSSTDVLSVLEPAKIYRFRAKYYVSLVYTSNSIGMTVLWAFGNSATPAAFKYNFKSFSQIASASGLVYSGTATANTATTVLSSVSSSGSFVVEIDGYIQTHATLTGSLTPQFQGVTPTSSTATINTGSWFEIEKLGTSVGPVNLFAGNWA
jgi:hypothetical protein